LISKALVKSKPMGPAQKNMPSGVARRQGKILPQRIMASICAGKAEEENNNLLPDAPIGCKRGCFVKNALTAVICFAVGFLVCCHVPPISLSPFPSRIERIEGYASLIITGDQGTTRSKFSFLFQLPNRGRIDVSGALGSVLYRIFIHDGEAYFIVPSKKIYWKGQEEEIIDKFMGFQLNLTEMINLLSGNWNQEDLVQKEALGNWIFAKDQKGRIVSGQRDDLRFEVKAFIEDTPFARRFIFEHPLSTGQVKVLSINLNRSIKPSAFSKKFVEKYQPKTWAEVQELLNHAR